MENETRNFIAEQVNALISAPSCCKEAKAAGQAWLEAMGTDNEAQATEALIAELKADIMPIDGLLSFAKSETGAAVFGSSVQNVIAHAEARKAAGEAYCDCAACTACQNILEKLGAL